MNNKENEILRKKIQKEIQREILRYRIPRTLNKNDKRHLSDSVYLAELLNPDGNIFKYKKYKEGVWDYFDSKKNLFFVNLQRFSLQGFEKTWYEFKTGWYNNNNHNDPRFSPSLPPITTGMDMMKRTNTIAKIYRDEILPFFEKDDESNLMTILPIDIQRYQFAIRLVKKLTPKQFKVVEKYPDVILVKKQTNN